MRTFGRWLGRILLVLLIVVGALWIFGPYESVDVQPGFDAAVIGDDVDAYLAAQEARFDDITEGVEKRVVWNGAVGEKTDRSVLYVHGFSATSEEIRPVPDRVAQELGANLVFTRLAGHGRTGEAMAEATAQQWMHDVAEGLEIARRVGDEVIVMATSTGATLMAEAALQPDLIESVSGVVMISPNFRIADPTSPVLTLPAARYWVPLVAGDVRSWTPENELHGKYWTTSYPTTGLFQMAGLVEHTFLQDYSAVTVPVLFMFSDADRVVDNTATREVADRWGGPVTLAPVTVKEGDDPYNHVIAGDILSPGMNDETVAGIFSWVSGL